MRASLSDAIEAHDLNELKRLINQKEVGVNERYENEFQFCPLVLAIQEVWLEGVEFLVHAKADVNTCDSLGWSVLQEACFLSDGGKMTRFLLQNGANADHKGWKGVYPIHTATSDRTVGSLKEICRVTKQIDVFDSFGESALCFAVVGGHILAVAVLLDHGAKIAKVTLDHPPPWFTELVNQRRSLKKTLIVLFACSKPLIAKDVAKILISMVWSTRDNDEWKIKTKKR